MENYVINYNGDKYEKLENDHIKEGDLLFITKVDGKIVNPLEKRIVSGIVCYEDKEDEISFFGENVKGLTSVLLNNTNDEFAVYRKVDEPDPKKDGGKHILYKGEEVLPKKDTDQVLDSIDAINSALNNPSWTIPIDNIAQDISDTHASTTVKDNINSPQHYNMFKFETIEVIEEWTKGFDDGFVGYNLGNALKYISRAPYKHNDGGLEDIEKAKKYLEFVVEYLKNNQNND